MVKWPPDSHPESANPNRAATRAAWWRRIGIESLLPSPPAPLPQGERGEKLVPRPHVGRQRLRQVRRGRRWRRGRGLAALRCRLAGRRLLAPHPVPAALRLVEDVRRLAARLLDLVPDL